MKQTNLRNFILFSFFESLQPVLVISSLFFMGIGYSNRDIFLLKTIFFLSVFIFDIPSGIALDHFGPRKTLTLSKSLELLGLLFLLLFKDWIFISAAMALMGISLAFIGGARASISKLLEEETNIDHRKSLAFANFGMLISYALTLSITGFSRTPNGAEMLIWIQVISTLMTVFFIRNMHSPSTNKLHHKPIRLVLKSLIRRDYISRSLIMFAIYSAIIRILVELLPFALNSITVDAVKIGSLLALVAIAMSLVSWTIASEKMPISRFSNEGWIFGLLSLSILAFAPITTFFSVIGLGIFVFIRGIGDVVVPSQVMNTSHGVIGRAALLSVGNTIGVGLAAGISFLMALISEASHMFLAFAALVVFALILILLTRGSRP